MHAVVCAQAQRTVEDLAAFAALVLLLDVAVVQ